MHSINEEIPMAPTVALAKGSSNQATNFKLAQQKAIADNEEVISVLVPLLTKYFNQFISTPSWDAYHKMNRFASMYRAIIEDATESNMREMSSPSW